jgi:hypothetical protein
MGIQPNSEESIQPPIPALSIPKGTIVIISDAAQWL